MALPRRRLRFVLASLLTLLIVGGPAEADIGVSIHSSAVDIQEALDPGDEYRLPELGVRNPGDRVTGYHMTIGRSVGPDARIPPASWFRFEPRAFTLQPGATRGVSVVLRIPPTASAGRYEALVKAEIEPAGQVQVVVGAAAATRLSFTVGGTPAAAEHVAGMASVALVVAAVATTAVLVNMLRRSRRRFKVQLALQRRR
jgi:hypothetical protein